MRVQAVKLEPAQSAGTPYLLEQHQLIDREKPGANV
jgi:hypothetical protein